VRRARGRPSGRGQPARGGFAGRRGAGARALDGRDYVIPDDVKALATAVLRHRMVLSPAAEIEGRQAEGIVADLVERVPAPR
jgi:MoxR-like ATPase